MTNQPEVLVEKYVEFSIVDAATVNGVVCSDRDDTVSIFDDVLKRSSFLIVSFHLQLFVDVVVNGRRDDKGQRNGHGTGG